MGGLEEWEEGWGIGKGNGDLRMGTDFDVFLGKMGNDWEGRGRTGKSEGVRKEFSK